MAELEGYEDENECPSVAELGGLYEEDDDELSVTYKLVPWLSWAEWNFVRESLFSSSPHSIAFALTRISTWRCRGCLPVAIDVTAAIIEIQQKDPLFRQGPSNESLDSDEMLAMAYCMVVMRLVNGFAEKSRRKTGLSISESADTIGIPRMLIDIRHECSHRDLPALPLVRLASMKALDWLKSYYWEPQRNSIPNIQKEVKSRMHELALYLHAKQAQRADSSQIKGRRVNHFEKLCGRKRFFSQMALKPRSSKSGFLAIKKFGFKKQITKIARNLLRLYHVSPSEVVTVLLEEFLQKVPDSSDAIKVLEGSDSSQLDAVPGDSKTLVGTVDEWKAIIIRLSGKEPALLLTMIEAVLKMIETREAMKLEMGDCLLPSSQYRAELRQIEHLSPLVSWLLRSLKKAKDSGLIVSKDNFYSGANLEATLPELLRKCLLVLTPSNNHLWDSSRLLAQMTGKKYLAEGLKKVALSSLDQALDIEIATDTDLGRILQQQEDSINQAAKKLEILKLRRKKDKTTSKTSSDGDMERREWTVVKSWSPCPIGVLPCVFGYSGTLPVLERADEQRGNLESIEDEDLLGTNECTGEREASPDIELLENVGAINKMRDAANEDGLAEGPNDLISSPVKGRLLMGGIWKKVGEEELLAIGSAVRIMV
ncbi:las1-like family protein [Tasmannia lanceolata]|uniref:las1-like family protein n=1 Tax=Tasmannia lanceolata TaxID=3420 RepID=UPI0040629173